MVRIAFDGFARKGEIGAREAPVPGLRQDVLGNHRNGIPLAEDARGEAEDGDKPHAQRHKAEGHNRLRGAFLEDHVSVEDEGLRMLSGVVWIDEKSVPVNESMVVRLPSGKKMRGVSRNQACVACAVASNGARYAEVAGKGHITSAECVRTYGAHIAKGSKIVHDGVFSHDRLVAAVGGESEVWKSTAKEAHARLQPVNSFIAEIEHYLNVHTNWCGNATK